MARYALWAGILLGFIGFLASALGVDDLLNQIAPFSKNKYIIRLVVSVAFFGVSAWGIVISIEYIFKKAISSVRARISLSQSFETYECTDRDIETISSIAMANFGQMSTNVAETKRLHEIDPCMFNVMIDGRGRIRGYFCIIRLTQAGVAALGRGEFYLATIPREYIRVDKKRNYQNVYIAAVFGDTIKARSQVLASVNAKLLSMRPTSIYARAATKDGLRLLQKHGFACLRPNQRSIGELFCKKIAARKSI